MRSEVQLLDQQAMKSALVTFWGNEAIVGVLYISFVENGRIKTSFESSEGHYVAFWLLEGDKLLLDFGSTQLTSRFSERCIRSVWEEVKPHLLS
jgi:hypothetical protein